MGLRKNVLYNSFLTTSLYVFQFITYPYVARVLGVTNIGICNFSQSIVTYFMFFSMLGVSILGVREIASQNGDKRQLDRVFSEIFQFNALLTLIVVVLYICAIELVPQLAYYKRLLYIGVFQIVFNTLTIEWLFKGLENFKYITIRTLFIRILYVICTFVFISSKDDYTNYFLLSSGVCVANGIINWTYGRRFVHYTWQPVSAIIKRYARPMSILGCRLILTSMYSNFNVVYLGFVSSDSQVGYYTTATKIQNIILALYSSFTLVMMPHICSLLARQDRQGVRQMIGKSFNLLYAFAFPIVTLSVVFAPEIIRIISGPGYEPAIPSLRMAMPLLLVIGLEQILIVQLLLPMQADRAVFINTAIGAGVGLGLNLLLVSKYQGMGSVIVWFVSELAVLLSANYFVVRKMGPVFSIRDFGIYTLSFIPLLALCYLLRYTLTGGYAAMLVAGTIAVLYCHANLYYVVKNEFYIDSVKRVFARFSNEKNL